MSVFYLDERLFCLLGLVVIFYLIRIAYLKFTASVNVRCLASQNGCEPVSEYAHSVPFMGIDFILRIISAYRERRILATFEDLSTTVGHTFGFWLLGNRWLITSEPENVKAILGFSVESFERGARRRWGFEPLTGDALHTADGPQWAAARALFRPFFTKSKVGDLDMIERHFKELLAAIPSSEDVSVDLQALFPCLTMDITTDMLFGSSTGMLKEGDDTAVAAFARACEYAQKVTWRRIALGWAATILPDKHYAKSLQLINEVIERYVQDALRHLENAEGKSKDDKKRESFLEYLAEHTQNPKTLRDLLLGTLLGGRDTSSYLLSNLFHVLARKPEIWKKLRAEAVQLRSDSITQEDMRKAPYARFCVQESLRFHPVVPGNQRRCSKTTVLPRGGAVDSGSPIVVREGTETIINVWAMQRRRDIWGEDAGEFKPERWENINPGWAYVPFSAGPKICVGKEFAMVETTYIVIRIAQCFETIRPADNEPWRENLATTLNSASGCKVYLRRAASIT